MTGHSASVSSTTAKAAEIVVTTVTAPKIHGVNELFVKFILTQRTVYRALLVGVVIQILDVGRFTHIGVGPAAQHDFEARSQSVEHSRRLSRH